MSSFITLECKQCGESFRASDGANASDTRYCSPNCHEEGEALA